MPKDNHQPQPYHLLYERDETLLSDDARARRRIASLVFYTTESLDHKKLSSFLDSELGIPGPVDPRFKNYWQEFYAKIDRKDFLSSISYASIFISERQRELRRPPELRVLEKFLAEVRRIFSEHCLRYTIDKNGTIHPLIDEAFEGARRSAVSTLAGAQYEAARGYVERIDGDLTAEPPDGASAIRHIFLAAENVFRQIEPRAGNLNAKDVRKALSLLAAQAYAIDQTAKQSATRMIEAFSDWIDAAHFYRHEQNQTNR